MNLLDSLIRYINIYDFTSPTQWAMLLSGLGLFWFLAVILPKINIFKGRPISQLLKGQAFAASFFMLCVVSVGGYYWANALFSVQTIQFGVLLGILIGGVLLLISLQNYLGVLKGGGLKDFMESPLTREVRIAQLKMVRKRTNRLFIPILLPLLGFISLTFFKSEKNLVSIVFDTSSSMSSANSMGLVPIEIGRTALGNAVTQSNKETDFIFTVFSEKETGAITDINHLLSISSPSQLEGRNTFFTGNEKEDALDYIGKLDVTTNGSPILECIWKNLLFTTEVAEEQGYDNVKSIIISDGMEANIKDGVNAFFCSAVQFDDFYTESGVSIINLAESDNPFMQKALDCGYQVEDGTVESAYMEAMDSVVADMNRDYDFVIWMVILVSLPLVIGLLILREIKDKMLVETI